MLPSTFLSNCQLIDDFKPSTYNYLLGDNILVAPIYTNSSSISITFPGGSTWIYWWNHGTTYNGGSTHMINGVPLDEYPVFFRSGRCIDSVLVLFLHIRA